jgi:cyclophilin family peptidyl-prolyl cis-trans isomerase
VTYNNTLDTAVDSMAAMGIFFQDDDFARPLWSLPDHAGASCSVKSPSPSARLAATMKRGLLYPVYQADYASSLTEPKVIELTTNAGPIDLYIDPASAPHAATYMHKMFTTDAINGSRIWAYQKDFLLGIAAPTDKAPQYKDQIPKVAPLMRSLPLEPSPLNANNLYALSLSHETSAPDSGFGGFSILLKKSPQLDKHYAVFGHIIPNAQTLKTMHAIEASFDEHKYYIVSGKEI